MKTAGRTPNWNLATDLEADLWTEVVAVTTKGRLAIPIVARRKLAWISGTAATQLLACLNANKTVDLLPWMTEGEKAWKRVQTALSALGKRERAELVQTAMDCYARVSLDDDGRVILPTHVFAHLDALGADDVVRFVVADGRLTLWSEAVWSRDREQRLKKLHEFVEKGTRT